MGGDRAETGRRLTVPEAAAELGTTSEGVRSRIKRGTLPTERESGRVWVILEGAATRPDAAQPGDRAELVEELRERVAFLEGELKIRTEENRRKDHLLAAALERIPAIEAPESPETPSEPVPDTPAPPEPGTPRVVASSVSHSRLGMSAWALAVGAIITLPTWYFSAADVYLDIIPSTATLPGEPPYPTAPFIFGNPFPDSFGPGSLVLSVLAPLLSGLWAGSTKRPSLPWFSSPHRWLRRGGRSVVEIATFTIGVPAWLALLLFAATVRWYSTYTDFAVFAFFTALVAFALAPLAFMSGALLGNALRRVGLLGTPKEPLQGKEEGEREEEVWTPRKQAQWGLAGSIIVALISALASVVAATLS